MLKPHEQKEGGGGEQGPPSQHHPKIELAVGVKQTDKKPRSAPQDRCRRHKCYPVSATAHRPHQSPRRSPPSRANGGWPSIVEKGEALPRLRARSPFGPIRSLPLDPTIVGRCGNRDTHGTLDPDRVGIGVLDAIQDLV